MAGAGGPLRLRDWLVAQIESGRYPGLRWEDAGKTLFRIPWKHAAKQGYQAQQDAALFRAWAIHKGKHLEGIDKEDPSTWKTRLRCALNKSADFCELPGLVLPIKRRTFPRASRSPLEKGQSRPAGQTRMAPD